MDVPQLGHFTIWHVLIVTVIVMVLAKPPSWPGR
jgi:hypothetical protein